MTNRRPYDHAGFDELCACCKAAGNPLGCKARGHNRGRLSTPGRAPVSYDHPPCAVCGSHYCESRRRAGSPLYCD